MLILDANGRESAMMNFHAKLISIRTLSALVACIGFASLALLSVGGCDGGVTASGARGAR